MRSFPGGWYIDALPSGAYCCLIPGIQLATHLGPVTLPPGGDNVLFLAIRPDGRAWAGQAHTTLNPAAYEWIADQGWTALPPPACGTNPVIYDRAGVLHRSDCAIGSQGYRYVADDGRLVTGDQTLVREVAPGVFVHEFTEVNGLLIGQGHESGVRVWEGSVLRLLHPGACFNIRVHHDGDRICIAFYTVAPGGGPTAYLYQTTTAELRALPISDPPPPPPPPPPVKDPTPMQFPEPIKAIRDRIVAQFPVPQMAVVPATGADAAFEDTCRAWVKVLAEQVVFDTNDTTWGLKNAGGGRPPSKDSLAHQVGGTLINYDLLGGVGTGRPTLVPNPDGVDITGQVFLPVRPVNHLSGPPPPPPPVGDTHRYVGGGNDTGTCDQCGATRVSAIHRVPEGLVTHAPWLGEDNKGDCDLCFQAVTAAIHTGEQAPPIPDRELARLRAENVALRVANAELADVIVALKALPPAAVHPSYVDNRAMAQEADAVFQAAQHPPKRGRSRVPIGAGVVAHLLWGFLFEGRTAADILAEARHLGSKA